MSFFRNWQLIYGLLPSRDQRKLYALLALTTISGLITVAKMANLHDLVTTSLPDQYKTIVGERGAKLNGGQRQRIGIARTPLYVDPEILILDEATNEFDGQNEAKIADALFKLTELI